MVSSSKRMGRMKQPKAETEAEAERSGASNPFPPIIPKKPNNLRRHPHHRPPMAMTIPIQILRHVPKTTETNRIPKRPSTSPSIIIPIQNRDRGSRGRSTGMPIPCRASRSFIAFESGNLDQHLNQSQGFGSAEGL